MYVCMYVLCMYCGVCTGVYVRLCMHVCMQEVSCVDIFVLYVHIFFVYVYVYMCIYVCTYMRMYVCAYICLYICLDGMENKDVCTRVCADGKSWDICL